MMNGREFFFFLFFLLFSSLAAEDTADVYILQTTDIHAFVFSDPGWIEEAAVIKQKINKLGKDKVLLVDCGDSLQGSFEGMVTQGEIGVFMLNELDYDVWVPGNHDFDFGLSRFFALKNKIKADTLTGNVLSFKNRMKAWKIYRKNGLKIAVIGMTYPWTDTMIWGKEIKNAGFRDIKSSLDAIMPEVMSADPDIVILAAHRWLYVPERLHGLSFFEIHRIYPQIDLFLGGHVHQTAEGETTPDGGYIAAAGAHAEYTAFIHITFSRKKRVILNIYSELISTEGGLPGAQSFSDALALQRDSIEAEAGKTVAYLDRNLPHQHIQKMLCREICAQTNADFSISALPDYVKELHAGIVRKKDIFKLEPYEDKVVVVTVSRDELKRIIGEMENLKRYNYIIAHSEGNLIEYSEKDNALNIISEVKDGEYKLAVFSFFAAGAGNRLPFLRRTADENSGRAVDSGLKVRTVLENIFKNKFPYITQKQLSEQ